MAANTRNTDILTASLGTPVPLAYGKHVVAGNVILKDETDLSRTVVLIALGEGEWDGIEKLYVNGAEVDLAASPDYHFHKGLHGELSSGGTLDPEGAGSPYPFAADGDQKVDSFTPGGVQGLTFSRTAYLALRIPFDVFAPGPALDVRGVFRTRKVRLFNSEGVQTGYQYSENPAWQIADLLTQVRGLPDSRLDWASFVAAANYCDQLIDPDGQGSVPRFVSNVAFTEEVSFDQALRALLATCRGLLLDTEGTIKLRIDQPRAPVFDFDMNNIVAGSFEASYRDTRESANRLELLFRDTENDLAVMTKLWNHEPQQALTGRVITARLYLGNLPQQQAERIGNYLLTRSIDNRLHCRLRSTAASLAVMPGDVVRVQHDVAPWSQAAAGEDRFQAFEVLEVQENPDETRDFLLRIYNPAAYPDTAGPSQNLLGTALHRRPLPPPPPEQWTLTANLGGELRLSFAIPQNADYRVADLTLLADEELERVQTTLAADLAATATTLAAASSAGFRVGDFLNVGTEILKIAGPGVNEQEPTSNTWEVIRAQKGTAAGAAPAGGAVYRLTHRRIHFVLPPGFTLAHPTLDLANGEYYVQRFRIGRLRILHAALAFTGRGGVSAPVEKTFAVLGASEPNVPGTLPGLRTSAGGMGTLQVPGPLAVGDDLVMPLVLPFGVSIGLVSAAVERAPTGQPVKLQLTLDGQDLGPVAEIPAGTSGEPSGTGIFFSGAEQGNAGGMAVGLKIVQVGSGEPGENLTVMVRV
ncbi:MAG TPA: phage tail protein [Terriglobia bacterium]|nr:phage tail protein [Terriglobia bacterium]